MKRSSDWYYLSALLVAAVLLRAPLVHIGLTIDDAFTAYVVEAQNWQDFIERIRLIEQTPPLYYGLLKLAVSIFGLTSPVLAITSLVFSVVAIPFIYLLGRACESTPSASENTGDRDAVNNLQPPRIASKVGLCAAFFATTSGLSILYAHEARAYSLAALLMTICLLLFVPFFDGRASLKRRIALFFATSLSAYAHYTTVPYIAIMIICALAYHKHGRSCSLQAIPMMVAGLATLIPWFPILKYHSSVGTPWADPTPLTRFPTVFFTNICAITPLPVVPTFACITLVLPALLLLYLVLKPSQASADFHRFMKQPKVVTLAVLFLYSASVFGFITPYIFGYGRYMTPIAPAGWVLLAMVTVKIGVKMQATNFIKIMGSRAQLALVTLLVAIVLYCSVGTAGSMSAQDKSGLRRLAADIAVQHFGKAAYITSPDFVGTILTYYLKHECNIPEQKLPKILGFAYAEGGYLPPRHDIRAANWQDPSLMSKYEKHIDDLKASGFPEIVLVRDTYTPTSKLIATEQLTNKLEALLRKKMIQSGPPQIYPGVASTYVVTRFTFAPAARAQ